MAQDIMMALTLEANLFVHQTRTKLTGAFDIRLLNMAQWTLPISRWKPAATSILEDMAARMPLVSILVIDSFRCKIRLEKVELVPVLPKGAN